MLYDLATADFGGSPLVVQEKDSNSEGGGKESRHSIASAKVSVLTLAMMPTENQHHFEKLKINFSSRGRIMKEMKEEQKVESLNIFLLVFCFGFCFFFN